jgi:hypothetical protein
VTQAAPSAVAGPGADPHRTPIRADTKYFLVRGSGPKRGKYCGVIAEGKAMEPETRSVYWTNQQQDVVLPASAVTECQADSEITVVVIRELTAEEAAAHHNGPLTVQQDLDLAGVSTDALEAALARRKAAETGASPKRKN